MYVLMYYRAPNVYVCNNATTSLHIHIFGVAAGMQNLHGLQHLKEENVSYGFSAR